MKVQENLLQDATDFSVDSITHIVKNFEKRPPGSKGEKDATDLFMNAAMDNGWADDLQYEDFQVAPKAFMAFTKVAPILIFLSWIFYVVSPIAAILLVVAALLVVFFQFVRYNQLLDPFCKKATGYNAMASKKPTGEVKRRIYIVGHPDAAYEWTLFQHIGMSAHVAGPVISIIGVFLTIGCAIASIVLHGIKMPVLTEHWWLVLIPLAAFPGLILLWLFSNYGHVVDGANDNLTGCAIATATLKYLKEAGVEFEHTEVVAMMGACEEAGLRGAKDFARRHAEEIKNSGVETVFIVLDTVRDFEHFYVYNRDLSGTVKLTPRVCELLQKGAAKTGRWEKRLPSASVWLGASDAAAFVQGGLDSAAIVAMDPAPAAYYHTRKDTYTNLQPDTIKAGIDVMIQTIEEFDQNGY